MNIVINAKHIEQATQKLLDDMKDIYRLPLEKDMLKIEVDESGELELGQITQSIKNLEKAWEQLDVNVEGIKMDNKIK